MALHDKILAEVGASLDRSRLDLNGLVDLFSQYERIFLVGAGRSGLVARFFGMRLMHLGKEVHIVGDTTTSRIGPGDLFVVISRSGSSAALAEICRKASMIAGTVLLAVTSELNSKVARYCHKVSIVDAPAASMIMPLGTGFELTALIFLETVVAALAEKQGITQETMQDRHANLE
jgi:6-phospho 3-hexuloisomerase